MTTLPLPRGCNLQQILRILCLYCCCKAEDREASLLWLLSSKAQHLTDISLIFQGSWWSGPCFSCLSSWLGCSESTAEHLALKPVSFPLVMASSHPLAMLVLSPNQVDSLGVHRLRARPGLGKGKRFPLFNSLCAFVFLLFSWWGPCWPDFLIY